MIINECCANCGCNLTHATEDGISGLYFPGVRDIRLCVSCFNEEDRIVELAGTNDIPERLARYLANIKENG